ncbi:hypothetical protein [Burkholderia plantarii]|uniref:hypothetical protein n=1 Tax=Burkholderia plantarii TaxID=41899 RepID=UPI00139239FB|nr:hypothetical protein [Burkholderia plantarii]WLE61743.1 hypothetical protein GIY62_30345 [Burkholderia plantarii]
MKRRTGAGGSIGDFRAAIIVAGLNSTFPPCEQWPDGATADAAYPAPPWHGVDDRCEYRVGHHFRVLPYSRRQAVRLR